MARFSTCMAALRVLARSNAPNRGIKLSRQYRPAFLPDVAKPLDHNGAQRLYPTLRWNFRTKRQKRKRLKASSSTETGASCADGNSNATGIASHGTPSQHSGGHVHL